MRKAPALGSIPPPPPNIYSLEKGMKVDHDTFKRATTFLRGLAEAYLDTSKSYKQQRQGALDKFYREVCCYPIDNSFILTNSRLQANKYELFSYYEDSWPIKKWLKSTLRNRMRIRDRRSTARNDHLSTVNEVNDNVEGNTDEPDMLSQATRRSTRLASLKTSRTSEVLPLAGSLNNSQLISRQSPFEATFKSFLSSCEPSLSHLLDAFTVAGIDNEASFRSLCKWKKDYLNSLLSDHMRLTHFQQLQVQIVLDHLED
ncbi:uncharacterized protein LAESUDRAFT_11696 [Laetiporus sulphureus 93-53]|uniref:Uncharacterized protein n=1 Tax=Laetiporus sulphureus 93-53 TaxID=1314785 RepID=A0A165I7E2_9APHY|nr:uncharacterized protein LAESUDRAFT_11696 [Laetiporus sulphureus 93-53]KZT12687.1 hypothetical protein LAESUDRAFT_11696 [Laetiporus sulphureus 93-53]